MYFFQFHLSMVPPLQHTFLALAQGSAGNATEQKKQEFLSSDFFWGNVAQHNSPLTLEGQNQQLPWGYLSGGPTPARPKSDN